MSFGATISAVPTLIPTYNIGRFKTLEHQLLDLKAAYTLLKMSNETSSHIGKWCIIYIIVLCRYL